MLYFKYLGNNSIFKYTNSMRDMKFDRKNQINLYILIKFDALFSYNSHNLEITFVFHVVSWDIKNRLCYYLGIMTST